MAFFPFTTTQNNMSLIRTTCSLYAKSLLSVLPLSLLTLLIIHFIRFGATYLPTAWLPYYKQSAMFALVLVIPLLEMQFSLIDQIGKGQAYTWGDLILTAGKRFLSVMGALLSMLFLPLILLGIGGLIYLFLGIKQAPEMVLMGWSLVVLLALYAVIVPKLFAPLLVLIESREVNLALDESNQLVKGHYIRTFFYTLYALLIIGSLACLPTLGNFYFPALAQKIPSEWHQAIGEGLVALIGPWSLALLLCQKYDLQARKITAS